MLEKQIPTNLWIEEIAETCGNNNNRFSGTIYMYFTDFRFGLNDVRYWIWLRGMNARIKCC
jgi:hypothetical protein